MRQSRADHQYPCRRVSVPRRSSEPLPPCVSSAPIVSTPAAKRLTRAGRQYPRRQASVPRRASVPRPAGVSGHSWPGRPATHRLGCPSRRPPGAATVSATAARASAPPDRCPHRRLKSLARSSASCKKCMWVVLSYELNQFFVCLILISGLVKSNIKVEYQGQIRYTRILDSKPLIDTYCIKVIFCIELKQSCCESLESVPAVFANIVK